jgi:hypothetical protein
MGFRSLADLSIPFSVAERTKRNGAAQKTEIHSTIGAVDLKDLPHPHGREQVRHWDDNNDHNIEQ